MDPLILSRAQFADTAAFHILWPLMSIGLSFFMLLMETMWLWTKKEIYYRQVRFWSKIFLLTFGIGVASGIPLQFQFGTNWAAFAEAGGDFFGNILGFESTVAFALESAFLAIFVFGWRRVGPKMHLFANAMVCVGATLSAFWIMAANSWMQTPAGAVVENGKLIVTDYHAAIFNPGTLVSFGHMWIACIETTLFFMLAWTAIALLRRGTTPQYRDFFVHTFKFALTLLAVVVPTQIFFGHMSGTIVSEYQPQKLAAIELHYDTNPKGEGAPFNIVALPNETNDGTSFALSIPNGLSLITTNSPTGQILGLNEFPEDTRPTAREALIASLAFRVMVGIGFLFVGYLLIGFWYWIRGYLVESSIGTRRIFLTLWVLAMPLGFIATIAGWMTREIGRQPWVVYNIMRTAEGLSSNLHSEVIVTTMAVFTVLFLAFIIFFVYTVNRIVKKGPNFNDIPPYIHSPLSP